MPNRKGRLTLPENPNLEQLRQQAKERLVIIRTHAPEAQLSDAQFALARDYGFSSWRELKDKVESLSGLAGYVGYYQHDPALIKNSYFHITQSDGYLRVERINGAKYELSRLEDGRFSSPGLFAVYGFEMDGAGQVIAMTLDWDGLHQRMMRITASEAKAIDIAIALAREEQRRPRTPVILSPEILDQYVGYYASPLDLSLEITREGANLFVQVAGQPRLPLFAEAEGSFFYPMAPGQINFHVEEGKAVALILRRGGFEQAMQRVSAEDAEKLGAKAVRRAQEEMQPRQPISVPPHILERYAGDYRVADLRTMTVTTEEGHLYAQLTGQSKLEIFPESETKFFWTAVAAQIEFYLDHYKRVSHAVLHQHGRLVPMSRLEAGEAAA